jgi:GAF domain-containing protein
VHGERTTSPGAIADKREAYRVARSEIVALIEGEDDLVANLGNAVATLKERLDPFWIGVYRLEGEGLVLGPFQGTPACTRIAVGRGVCGTAVARGETIVVEDVNVFPGHIACDSRSLSEIVVLLRDREGRVRGVLDVDSDRRAAFDAVDRDGLEAVAEVLRDVWS